MDAVAFATHPAWTEMEAAVYRPVAGDLMKRAAHASREDHDRLKGQMEGADVLWARLQALRAAWAREETPRG